MTDIGDKVKWNSQIERIISEQGERALCYSWLHTNAEKMYSSYYNYIALPTIVLSTIAGTASIGSQTLFNDVTASSIGIGAISLVVGVLNTVSTHFGWAKRSEAHRQTAVAYSKIHRFILVELSLPRMERIEASNMLKFTREQIDRLEETSPQVPESIIKKFKKTFGDTTPELSKPEITNGLDPIQVYVEGSSPHDYFISTLEHRSTQTSPLSRPLVETDP